MMHCTAFGINFTILLGNVTHESLANGTVLLDGDIIQEDITLDFADVTNLTIGKQVQERGLARSTGSHDSEDATWCGLDTNVGKESTLDIRNLLEQGFFFALLEGLLDGDLVLEVGDGEGGGDEGNRRVHCDGNLGVEGCDGGGGGTRDTGSALFHVGSLGHFGGADWVYVRGRDRRWMKIERARESRGNSLNKKISKERCDVEEEKRRRRGKKLANLKSGLLVEREAGEKEKEGKERSKVGKEACPYRGK